MKNADRQWALDWGVKYPWRVIVASLVLWLVAASGLQFFKLTNDPRSFFGKQNPDLQRFQAMEADYASHDVLLYMLVPKNGDAFSQQSVQLLRELTEEAWSLPKSIRVSSPANFQYTQVEGDDLQVDYLVPKDAPLSPQRLKEIREIALHEPALLNSLVSPKGHVTAVAVNLVLDENRADVKAVSDAAYQLRDQFQARYPDIEIKLTGTVIFYEAMSQATNDSMETTTPLSLLVAVFFLMIFVRGFMGTFSTIFVVMLSISFAMGVFCWLGIHFQPISGFAPAIILTLAIADCLHILVSYQQQRRLGDSKPAAMQESLRINRQPVVLTSVTTAIGFICLNTSESPPFRDLGNIVAVGVMVAMVYALWLLPALTMVLPDGFLKLKPSKNDWSQRAMEGIARIVIEKRYSLLVGVGLLLLTSLLFLKQNDFNDVWIHYFDETYEVRKTNDFMMRELTGVQRLEFSIPAREEGGVSEPEYLQRIDDFKAWAKGHEHVVYAASFSDVMKRLNRTMNGDDEQFYTVPKKRDLASQYLLMYELSLPQGLGLDDQVTIGKDATKFVIVMNDGTSGGVLQMEQDANQWIADHFPSYMQTKTSGLDVLFSGVAKRNMISMLSGTFAALLVISVLIMVALKSVRYGLLSILPNILPALIAFGFWGILSGHIGLSTSVVACLTMGIVVDDTIHFLSKYVRAKREQQLNTQEAVFYAFKTVGVALVSTSVILASCFFVMATSHFKPNSDMGLLTSMTIVIALVVDFLFFAPLLVVMDERRRKRDCSTNEKDSSTLDSATKSLA